MKKKRFFYLFLLVIFLGLNPSFSQNKTALFNHLSVKDGLSQNGVMSIFKDSKGYMWFGTRDGLNRYDGYGFKIYRHDDQNPNSISSNAITVITEDNKGILWIGTKNGLNSFDPNIEKFTTYKNDTSDNLTISNNEIFSILIAKNDDIWVGTRNGLNKKPKDSNTFEKFYNITNDPNSLGDSHVFVVYQDSKENIWVGTQSGGLNKFIKSKKQFVKYVHNPKNPNSIASNTISCIVEGKDNKLWVGTGDKGISVLNTDGKFSHIKHIKNSKNTLSNNIVRKLVFDDNDNLWIGTYFGLNYYNIQTGKFEVYLNSPLNPKSISHNSIISLYLDNAGLLWSGTFFGGLNLVNLNAERFLYYQHNPLNKNSLSYNVVSALVEDEKGNIWIGTEGGGLNYFDYKRQLFSKKETFYGIPLNFKTIKSLLIDKNQNLWIGTHLDGLLMLNFKTKKVTKFLHEKDNPNSLSDNSIISLIEDHLGTIWIGTEKGLNIFTPNDSRIERVNLKKNNSSVISLLEDSNNNIWVGTRIDGLILLGNGTIKYYVHDKESPESIGEDGVFNIFEDSKKRLWISTYGGGLNLMDKTNGSFKKFKVKDGLINNVTYNIEENNNDLWISTPSGISKFNLESKKFKNYSANNGLPIEEFNIRSSLHHSSGKLFFGGFNGLISFNPDNTPDSPFIPNLYIIDLKLNNKSVLPNDENKILDKHISETKHITFSHDQSIFSIDFVALNYMQLGQNQYAYMLEGLDPDWNYIGNKKSATYTNLESGDYTFKVKAANNDGVWNENITTLKITKLPPFWKTWWAYLLYFLLASVLLLIIRKYFLIKLHLENDLKLEKLEKQQVEDLTKLKLKFFTNISHDFRTPLTLIYSPLQNLIERLKGKEEEHQLQLIEKNVNLMLRLINQLMDFRKMQTGKLSLKLDNGPIIPFVKEILYSFKDLAKKHKIEFSFISRTSIKTILFDKDKIEKILYNLLSNAFKYTPSEGGITIEVSENENQDGVNNFLEISVKNTGSGIDEKNFDNIFDRFYQGNDQTEDAQAGSGVGLSLVKNLIELHKGYIKVNSKKNEYATFIIGLPLDENIYTTEEKAQVKTNNKSIESNEFNASLKIEKKNYDANKHTVLVVEDNYDLRYFLRDILVEDYNVEIAEDGEVGLEMVKKHKPNLVVSDITMPKMSGLELCKAIKTDSKTSHIPVILLTARTAVSSQLDGYHTGANDFISKPFNIDILKSKIHSLLDSMSNIKSYSRKEVLLDDNEININSADEKFLENLSNYIRDNISDTNLNVNKTSKDLGMSRVQLYRKVKAITNKSAVHFIRDFRLSVASKFLEQDNYNVNEICFKVGFQEVSYFRKCFKEKYGMSPKQYADSKQDIVINTSDS